jgi:hypothetical protein
MTLPDRAPEQKPQRVNATCTILRGPRIPLFCFVETSSQHTRINDATRSLPCPSCPRISVIPNPTTEDMDPLHITLREDPSNDLEVQMCDLRTWQQHRWESYAPKQEAAIFRD